MHVKSTSYVNVGHSGREAISEIEPRHVNVELNSSSCGQLELKERVVKENKEQWTLLLPTMLKIKIRVVLLEQLGSHLCTLVVFVLLHTINTPYVSNGLSRCEPIIHADIFNSQVLGASLLSTT